MDSEEKETIEVLEEEVRCCLIQGETWHKSDCVYKKSPCDFLKKEKMEKETIEAFEDLNKTYRELATKLILGFNELRKNVHRCEKTIQEINTDMQNGLIKFEEYENR